MKSHIGKMNGDGMKNTSADGRNKTGNNDNGRMTLPVEKDGKFLTFSLGEEAYGIGILKVREIIGMMPITRMPKMPPYVKGVVNLRGKVIPIIDLRLCFEMEEKSYDERTCIIVVEVKTEKANIVSGIVVDSVSEVLTIQGQNVEAPPEMNFGADEKYITGIAKMEGGVKMLLDIDAVISGEELGELIGA